MTSERMGDVCACRPPGDGDAVRVDEARGKADAEPSPSAQGLDEAAGVFMELQPRLFGIAYRVLGSAVEAEDVVQEVWLRWQKTDRSAVVSPWPSSRARRPAWPSTWRSLRGCVGKPISDHGCPLPRGHDRPVSHVHGAG